MTSPVSRVAVVGSTGTGKTTLARELSRRTGLPHTELDQLRYAKGWKEAPPGSFYERVSQIAATDAWIIDGNYASVRGVVWSRAQLVVWLDYPLALGLARLLLRTIRRVVTHADVGNGNREQLSRLLGRRSIFLWAVRSHAPLRTEYEMASANVRDGSPLVLRHRSPKDTDAWLAGFR